MADPTEGSRIVEEKVLQEADLGDLQMKEVPFTGGKVLLSKVDGRISATSHACTHFGAPLVKGTLTKSGLILCPWHAAAFCVGYKGLCGDIEDGPAWDSLKMYDVSTSDGWIVVKGERITSEEASAKSWLPVRPVRLPNGLKLKRDGDAVVIVGGGPAALGAVSTLRDSAFSGPIIVLSSETLLSINRFRLSKGAFSEKDFPGLQLRNQKWFDDFGVDFRLGTTVTSVDLANSAVTASTGATIPYTKLLLSPGATPRVLTVPNHNLSGIHQIRTGPDAVALTTSLSSASAAKNGVFDIVVVGTSFIAGEFASYVIKAYPNATVTLVGSQEQPMATALGAEVGRRAFRAAYERKGVKFVKGSLASYTADVSGTKVASVTLNNGTEVPADVVLTAVGAIPSTGFLKSSGVPLLPRDGSILADAHLRVRGVSNVYAAGDAVTFPDAWTEGSGDIRIEHWDVAINQGRLAGRNIARDLAGQDLLAFDVVPFFWTGQLDKSFRFAGHLTKPYPGSETSPVGVEIKGDPESPTAPHFSAWYYEKATSKVVAVLTLNEDPKAVQFAARLSDGGSLLLSEVDSL
ncbi:FAD/NAD(P)-binding domain-containing protein [Gonapodya prolifera JEL478]|uniref:FAD/NAD(P)-binding domain-containing protein n=1 Tax=Gonapodya prolifera (strain JEL478) TaxID=1344416 RepID=A0A139A4T7_GONPJ|nr:FAD/NAD(P)-binding domain-containing protein [Gonapodya prolifera JEL478]|eukprot:KXS11754.1 FAD/NAD(P)-binding domain-containing protein [Gonapodya prolifera JEL478]